jgi:elongation factor G
MKSFATENIRNLAVIGHGDAGKTQLVSSLLHVAGTSHRWGKVEEGTTITDYEEDSIARKVSLNNNFAHAEYQDTKINFIDTPGYAAFVSHARPALRVAASAARKALRNARASPATRSHASRAARRSGLIARGTRSG